MNVTIDLAKKHIIDKPNEAGILRADLIKVIRYAEELETKVKNLSISGVTNFEKLEEVNNIDEVINEKELLWKRIDKRLHLKLKQQKAEGKKFITDEQIDSLIDQIIEEETN